MVETNRRVLALRGVSAAVIATFFAALSHGMAGMSGPSAPAIVWALILSVFVCIALAGKKLSPVRIGLSVVIAQSLFHALFAFLPAGGANLAPAASAGHVHGGPVVISALEPLTHAGHAGPIMWVAHVVAAVVTWLFLLHGEAALYSLVRELRLLARVRILLGILTERPLSRARVLVAEAITPLRERHLEIRCTRGPPVPAGVSL